MIGVVPAAGDGTRLRPHTANTPKGLVEVGDDPLLVHVFETLLDSGVDELVVVVGYRASDVIGYFGESYSDCPITYVHQRERRGLGHAISRAEPHVDGPFVVLNGDNVVAGDLQKPLERFQQDAVDAVVTVEEVDRDTAHETGVVTVENGQVTGMVEKPADPPSLLAATGCYLLPNSVFDALSLLRPSDRGEYELADAIGVLVRAGARIDAVELDSPRVNVNTPADVEQAEELLVSRDA